MPSAAAEDVVRGFLDDVRSGRHPERADRYLAPVVTAHQGRPGAERGAVRRAPAEYAEHVRDMLADVGPWEFTVATLDARGDLVEATWRQDGRLVEHGWARYRVADGLIREYWIDVDRAATASRQRPGPEFRRRRSDRRTVLPRSSS